MSTARVQAIFATSPLIDYDELRQDLDAAVDGELPEDPLEGTGL